MGRVPSGYIACSPNLSSTLASRFSKGVCVCVRVHLVLLHLLLMCCYGTLLIQLLAAAASVSYMLFTQTHVHAHTHVPTHAYTRICTGCCTARCVHCIYTYTLKRMYSNTHARIYTGCCTARYLQCVYTFI